MSQRLVSHAPLYATDKSHNASQHTDIDEFIVVFNAEALATPNVPAHGHGPHPSTFTFPLTRHGGLVPCSGGLGGRSLSELCNPLLIIAVDACLKRLTVWQNFGLGVATPRALHRRATP